MKKLKPLLACLFTIIVVFIAISLLDIVIAVIFIGFYTSTTFVLLFGVGGIFGSTLGFINGIEHSPKTQTWRWVLISFITGLGFFIYFFLSALEGGEYEPAFKGFGATLAIGSFLFARGKVDF